MKQAIALKLSAALRSNEYIQGRNYLRDRNSNRFCPLGIICNLHALAHPKLAAHLQIENNASIIVLAKHTGTEMTRNEAVLKAAQLVAEAESLLEEYVPEYKDFDEETYKPGDGISGIDDLFDVSIKFHLLAETIGYLQESTRFRVA